MPAKKAAKTINNIPYGKRGIIPATVANFQREKLEEINSNESPKVLVKSCKFSSDSVHSLKLDESNSHAGNTFNYVYSERNDEKERNAYSWKLIAGIVVSAFAVMVVAIAASIFYCRENDDGITDKSKESGETQPDL